MNQLKPMWSAIPRTVGRRGNSKFQVFASFRSASIRTAHTTSSACASSQLSVKNRRQGLYTLQDGSRYPSVTTGMPTKVIHVPSMYGFVQYPLRLVVLKTMTWCNLAINFYFNFPQQLYFHCLRRKLCPCRCM